MSSRIRSASWPRMAAVSFSCPLAAQYWMRLITSAPNVRCALTPLDVATRFPVGRSVRWATTVVVPMSTAMP